MPNKPRRDLIRERLINYLKPKEGINYPNRVITQSLARRIFSKAKWINEEGTKIDKRTLIQAESFVLSSGHLPYLGVANIIKSYLKSGIKKVNFLDVGSGEGNLKVELETEFGNQIGYMGLDLKQRRRKQVKQSDIVIDKLPVETYHVIFAINSFQYLPDKFRALENMINALKPGGILRLITHDHFLNFFRVRRGKVNQNIDWNVLKEVIERLNPFIEINVSKRELRVIKKSRGKVNLPFRYLGSKFLNADVVSVALTQNKFDGRSAIMSYYELDESVKTKW